MSHPPLFCVAGVALMALGGALVLVLVACDAAALCMTGVAQCHIHLRFTWQAWHMHTYIHAYMHTYIHAYMHTCIHTCMHTYMHACMHAYVRTYIHTYHFVTHNCFTTSFVFPSFLVPATTFGAHYWKKLTCGVIRSFNFLRYQHAPPSG